MCKMECGRFICCLQDAFLVPKLFRSTKLEYSGKIQTRNSQEFSDLQVSSVVNENVNFV